MKLVPWQTQVAEHPARFKIVAAGRRSGKTFLAIRQLCWYAHQPNRTVFYITSSYRAAKMIVWKPLKNRLLDLRWVKKINESELSIELVNGSTISLKGSENKDSLRGVSLSYCVIDEAADCDPDLFPEIVRPALADQRGDAMFIGTPKSKSNYFYDLYTAAQQNDAWLVKSLKTSEAGFVDPGELEQAKQEMTESQYRQEFEASFEDTGSRVAYNFTREQNVKPYVGDPPKEICIGIDFNVNPISAVVGVRLSEGVFHAIDEIYIYSSNTEELVQEVKHRYPTENIFVFPDPSGSRTQTSSSGRSDFNILTNAGFAVKAPRKHDPVKDRINAFNARCRTASGAVYLYVDPRCKKTIEALEKHSYKEGTVIPDKDRGYDHAFDAFSYAIAYLYPIRRAVQPQAPATWGQKITV